MDPLFVAITQLGDVWFVLLLLSTLYLSGGRLPGLERSIARKSVAHVMALGIGAIGLTFALELLLEIPQPPGAAVATDPAWLSGVFLDLYREAAWEGGYDVPSGHAVGAVAIYGGLALAYGGSRRALVIAAGMAGLIAISRVVIGVHSLSAVVIGVLVGASYLWLATAVTDGGRHVTRAFLVAGTMALAALATGGFGHDVAAVLGLAGGGALAWHLFGEAGARGLGSGLARRPPGRRRPRWGRRLLRGDPVSGLAPPVPGTLGTPRHRAPRSSRSVARYCEVWLGLLAWPISYCHRRLSHGPDPLAVDADRGERRAGLHRQLPHPHAAPLP